MYAGEVIGRRGSDEQVGVGEVLLHAHSFQLNYFGWREILKSEGADRDFERCGQFCGLEQVEDERNIRSDSSHSLEGAEDELEEVPREGEERGGDVNRYFPYYPWHLVGDVLLREGRDRWPRVDLGEING